jgi:hypothetical protein
MFDLLTQNESERARAQGWQLSWVVTGDKALVDVLPSWTSHQVKNAAIAYQLVARLAKAHDATALKALQLCVRSRQPVKPTRKRSS